MNEDVETTVRFERPKHQSTTEVPDICLNEDRKPQRTLGARAVATWRPRRRADTIAAPTPVCPRDESAPPGEFVGSIENGGRRHQADSARDLPRSTVNS
jgi:hypothetical protein